MRDRSKRRLEEMLRSGASRARRDPSPALRSSVRAAIQSETSPVERDSVAGPVATPVSTFAARDRRQVALVAAAALVGVGLWVFAFLDPRQETVRRFQPTDRTAWSELQSAWRDGISAIEGSASPEALARLARAGPRTLRTAVDDPLLAEVAGIGEDATRAARFLAGRVPASLVARPNVAPRR